jgi:3D (Asp-Asp-Asp) domain-containing protein
MVLISGVRGKKNEVIRMKYLERMILAIAFLLSVYIIIEMAILHLTPKEEIPLETRISNSPARVNFDNEPKRKESSAIIAHEEEEIEKIEYEIYEVTAYTAGFESTGKHPDDPMYGITASGEYVKENHTIACGQEHEFGTEIFIPYFDTIFTCEDRGGAITEGKIDVYIPILEDALEFGRRDLEVIVIDLNDFEEKEKERWHK